MAGRLVSTTPVPWSVETQSAQIFPGNDTPAVVYQTITSSFPNDQTDKRSSALADPDIRVFEDLGWWQNRWS
ncbi:hypothetical protein VN97_g12686 [Penicillium thymicola]|uniref:Uncharacterized protein n=1 Tax=Penicillium thymicola TaxID=293382 RepID=A0AAI9X215_PENTH|nr:hypothetical protein VN97_g12686 [Penicillium thymicola]